VAAWLENGFGGASGKTPETFTYTPAGGVHYFVIGQ